MVTAPTRDGFVIALPYGTSANRVRNVLAARSATLVTEGVRHRVRRPEVLPLEAMDGSASRSGSDAATGASGWIGASG